MRLTGQTCCAYCGVDFTAQYTTWLTMALDHVVPRSVCVSLGIPEQWREDGVNRVLACGACNGFRNRYRPIIDDVRPMSLDVFFDLRDRIFAERSEQIAAAHRSDRAFFESRPWLVANQPAS